MPHTRRMNTYTDGQTYTFTDWEGITYQWTRTNGQWVGHTVRDDAMIAALQADGFGEVA